MVEHRDVSDDQINNILSLIDEDTAMSVSELSDQTGHSIPQVKRILEVLMVRGQITSTPDWKYRQSR